MLSTYAFRLRNSYLRKNGTKESRMTVFYRHARTVLVKTQQSIPKVENNYPRSSPFHHSRTRDNGK